MTKKTMSAPVRDFHGSAHREPGPVTELPAQPAALGKEVAALVQEALAYLPKDGVEQEPPRVCISVSVSRGGVELTAARVKIPYDMNHLSDERPPSPAELLAFATALKGENIPKPDGNGYLTLEVDVR